VALDLLRLLAPHSSLAKRVLERFLLPADGSAPAVVPQVPLGELEFALEPTIFDFLPDIVSPFGREQDCPVFDVATAPQ
jgi:hypothetical protein